MTTGSTQHSADEQSEAERIPAGQRSRTNVSRWERAASAALGGALLVRGLRRRSLDGAASAVAGAGLLYRGVRGHSRLYQALGITTADGHTELDGSATSGEPSVKRSITVGRPADELDEFWREPERLSRILGDFAAVSGLDGDTHQWHVRGPLDRRVEWQTEIVEDRPGELLRWESLDGAVVPHEATIRFELAAGDRGTRVSLEIQYDPPGGSLGDAAMERLGIVPETVVGQTLQRFKSLAETGEIPSTEANPSARGTGDIV
ncbi:cyclase [Natronococcus pandeyae]|uniref:Cyclase n=1 Tax=Natronococcus pandeyae TaxID=2055836 RepID=A0A8J8Q4Y7_9EURY|nr:SRPBCC family protein [Natronococcus pandeyae]TYL39152.1 cyclase [Natronococcus pandeyae]